MLPRLVRIACSREPIQQQRARLVPLAEGRVLEIGIGPGLNFPFYDVAHIDQLWGIEPGPEFCAMARAGAQNAGIGLYLVQATAERMPLDTASIDTIVLTYTLCSIPDPEAALAEMRRVLKPGGRLLFSEHGSAPDGWVRRWQDWLNPLWKRVGGGCHLNRHPPSLLTASGFRIGELHAHYMPGWKPVSFNYRGIAVQR